EKQEVASFQTVLLDGVVERKRNGARRRIPKPFDVDDHLLRRNTDLFGGRLNNSAIRLMRDEEIDLARLDAVALEDSHGRLLRVAHGELEHGRAILLDIVKPLIDRVVRRGPQAAARWHTERVAAAAIDVILEIDDADLVVIRCFDDNRTRTVAEKHAG